MNDYGDDEEEDDNDDDYDVECELCRVQDAWG